MTVEPQTPIEPIDDDIEDHDEPFESMTMPAMATNHLPGTNAKIEVLRRRLERGELLWHPDDMTFEQHGKNLRKSETDFPCIENQHA